MSVVDDLIAIEDKKFLDAVDEIIEYAKAMNWRGRWRDGHGVMHELQPVGSVAIMTGKQVVSGTAVTCGYKRRSNVQHDPESVITCLRCLGASDVINAP